jgi:Fe-S-cluster containining protein
VDGHTSVFGITHGEIPLLVEEVTSLVAEGLEDLTHKLDDGFWYLRLDAAGRCPFLSPSGMCKRHNLRFASCKSYPYFLEKYSGLVVDQGCPAVQGGTFDIESARDQLNALADLMQGRIDTLRQIIKDRSKDQE